MDIKDLARIDLNMLVALEVLLEERNVSRAAERLFITQSAMSKTLGRLRNLFDDPLFTRTYAGMQPTPRAEEIAERLPSLLQGLKCLVQPPRFDPLKYQGEFALATPDYIAGWLLPPLFVKFSEQAPGIRLNFARQSDNPLESLANGKLDFLIQPALKDYPPDFDVMTVGFAAPRLFVRKGHPLEGTEPDWEEIEKYPQIELHMPEKEASEAAVSLQNSALARHLHEKPPQIILENLFIAVRLAQKSNGIFLGPPLFAELADLGSGLTTLPFPEKEDITLKFVIVRHQRVSLSSPHQYIYQQIIDCVEHHRQKIGLPCFAEMRKLHQLDY